MSNKIIFKTYPIIFLKYFTKYSSPINQIIHYLQKKSYFYSSLFISLPRLSTYIFSLNNYTFHFLSLSFSLFHFHRKMQAEEEVLFIYVVTPHFANMKRLVKILMLYILKKWLRIM